MDVVVVVDLDFDFDFDFDLDLDLVAGAAPGCAGHGACSMWFSRADPSAAARASARRRASFAIAASRRE